MPPLVNRVTYVSLKELGRLKEHGSCLRFLLPFSFLLREFYLVNQTTSLLYIKA